MSAADGSWFTPDLFVREPLSTTTYRVISIDPGINAKPAPGQPVKRVDPAGLAVVSFSHQAKKAQVDEVFELNAKSLDMKAAVLKLLAKYPDIRGMIYEATQGGTELFYATYGYDFTEVTGVQIHFVYPKQSKLERAELLLSRYKKGQVVHAQEHTAYERELLSFPYYLRSPNQTDAVSQAVDHLAKMTPERSSTFAVRRM